MVGLIELGTAIDARRRSAPTASGRRGPASVLPVKGGAVDAMSRYLDRVDEVIRGYPDQREGQAYYNALRMIWPDLQHEIVGTERDCYSDDRRLPAFLDWVEQVLSDDMADTAREHQPDSP
jgi:hypothetical protein